MFESANTTLILSALSFGFASVVYILYGPSQSSGTSSGRNAKRKSSSNSTQITGLYNMGNHCFVNAILQSLASCKSLLIWLSYANRLQNNCENTLTYHVLKTLAHINGDDNTDDDSTRSPYTPNNVLQALRSHRWSISNEEQDAFELFNVLTSTLEHELYTSLPVYSLRDALLIDQMVSSSPESSATISTRGSNLNSLLDNTIPKSLPSRGMLASQLYCRRCGYKYAVHLDTFETVSLVLPQVTFPIQLQDCLNKFVSNEILYEVNCEACGQLNHASNQKSAFVKKLNFAKLPELLCFHIQRLVWLNNGQPMKRCEHIVFPEYLNMDPYAYKSVKKTSADLADTDLMTTIGLIGGTSTPIKNRRIERPTDLPLTTTQLSLSQNDNIAKYKYKLYSVIVHLGNASSGHFICYRRGFDQNSKSNWFYTSDTNVLEVDLSEVLNSCAYMLFYERIRN